MTLQVIDDGAPGAPPIEGRPLPQADNLSQDYWAAASEGKLLFQECPACGNRQFYPRSLCIACGETPEWKDASGRGTVHTFTIIRQNWADPFRGLMPYVVAMVELEEGPRMMTNLTDCDPEEVSIGAPVEAYVVKVEDGLGLPFWRLAR